MSKIMETVAKETHGKSYRTYKYSYDSIGIPKIDYEDENDKEIVWLSNGVPAETDDVKKSKNLRDIANEIQAMDSLLTYYYRITKR